MNTSFFVDKLYPLQDEVLPVISRAKTGFYLSGGTAASRGYLFHRFSEDLDLFVNDDPQFSLWAEQVLERLRDVPAWQLHLLQKEERFVRCEIRVEDVAMRIEMVNDVPAHVGNIVEHAIFGRLDSPENILANKITALVDREEPKDLADVWGFCTKMGLSLGAAIEDARSKAAGIFPADLARVLCSATEKDWQVIRWIQAPPAEQFISDLGKLGEGLIL
jgi:hypothetical protein